MELGPLLEEIVPYLDVTNEGIRAHALQIVLAGSVTAEGAQTVLSNNEVIAKLVLALEWGGSHEVLSVVVDIVTNLFVESEGALDALPYSNLLCVALRKLASNECVELYLALLANVTTQEAVCGALLDIWEEHSSDTHLAHAVLMEPFLAHDPLIESDGTRDCWELAGSVICNLCRLERGRHLLCDPPSKYVPRMTKQMHSRSTVRRRGTVGAIHNCLFDNDIHGWMVFDVDIVTHLLLPLIGSELLSTEDTEGMHPRLRELKPDKEIEHERDIVVMLLESILLLCVRRDIRDELRQRKVYPVIRAVDNAIEGDEAVAEIIYKIVNFLQREERKTAVNGSASTLHYQKEVTCEDPQESLVQQLNKQKASAPALEDID
jgi:hypothetical protein